MKKYFRAKDGVYKIYDTHNGATNHWGYKVNERLTMLLDEEDIKNGKTADTIEDLCDEWIFFDDKNEPHYKSQEPEGIWLLGAAFYNKSLRLGIFTDKGLVYVAKMNNKGELELL